MTDQLSPHVSREEFEHSGTAARYGLANRMGPVELAAAKSLCMNVLEPVRRFFGAPLRINSGYRSPAVNLLVGSKPGSQHERGEACDFEIEGVSNYDVAHYIKGSTIDFDQLILEAYHEGDPRSGCVHVSRKPGMRQRRQVLTMTLRSHGAAYLPGLVA